MAPPVLDTCAGALSATGRTTIGERTLWVPSLHVSWPPVYALKGAVVRVMVVVNDCVSPGARVSDAGFTTTVKPASPLTEAEYVAALPPTLVTLRVTAWTPARSP